MLTFCMDHPWMVFVLVLVLLITISEGIGDIAKALKGRRSTK